ncbi:MAG: hypothetical protein BJBARM5_0208 [Candidatus Parvarchaeum acidophilus ARMAN-5]|jgi:uncharacterized membrane protein YuzA (DUF378 family)|uniref:Uncharacterized protein n=1 Tax=Candidatus Parvarchaeum acidophilus ARMAN-5 TaxID=662762 RepID=D6GUR2_PARA5|nr:MAG: hypothetical protein BJBARM5_0208 [Candidatus Parvarchaeum acidophilus ARMAN-5]
MIDEVLTKNKRITIMVVVLGYFLVGFLLILIFLTRYFGPNGASFIGIAYLAVGWLFLYKWKFLFKIMKIKYK